MSGLCTICVCTRCGGKVYYIDRERSGLADSSVAVQEHIHARYKGQTSNHTRQSLFIDRVSNVPSGLHVSTRAACTLKLRDTIRIS